MAITQPPSGGCVLKQAVKAADVKAVEAAAFRRLCVETCRCSNGRDYGGAAAFRRLCVETINDKSVEQEANAAAFRRLCVETIRIRIRIWIRLAAAFRRLCVETKSSRKILRRVLRSRLQAAVC